MSWARPGQIPGMEPGPVIQPGLPYPPEYPPQIGPQVPPGYPPVFPPQVYPGFPTRGPSGKTRTYYSFISYILLIQLYCDVFSFLRFRFIVWSDTVHYNCNGLLGS